MLIFPLAADSGLDFIKNANEMLGGNEALTNSIGTLAAGIGGIFLLFVLFYYGTSILDGGKFQVKMLMPILIYVCACNFSWITQPVTAFVGGIRDGLSSSINDSRRSLMASQEGGSETDTLMDVFNRQRKKENEESKARYEAEMKAGKHVDDIDANDDGTSSSSDSQDEMKEKMKLGQRITNAISNAFSRMFGQWSAHFTFSKETTSNFVKYSITGLLSSLLCWVNNIMEQVMKIFGASMAGIVLAFGPIVWAFAVFPGRGKTVMTWFIRMCQFALYGPITAFICLLNTHLSLSLMADMSAGGNSMFALTCGFAANIAAMTSVPSIAQMIIEGASGGVSLSSGLQMMAHALTTAGSTAIAPLKMGKALHDMKVAGDNKQANVSQGNTLENIAQTLNGMSNGGSYGQNSHKSNGGG